MGPSDEQLINRVKAGDQPAFGQLIDRYQAYVFSLCLRILVSREEAEEAAQDVFVKVYQRLRSFRHESKFSTWLYTMAYRTAIDHRRQIARHRESNNDMDVSMALIDKGVPAAAEQLIQHQEQQAQLKSLLARLPQQEALLIDLFYLQEQSVREIAKITKLSVSNVKTKLFRTREKLRNLMQQHSSTDV